MGERGNATERPERPEVSDEMRERRKVAMRSIRQWGDPVLRSQTNEVTDFGPELRQQIEEMSYLMDDAIGCGLAAPQVGSLSRFFIYKIEADGPVSVLINPVITWRSDEEEVDFEGCLSLEPIVVEVSRAVSIRVEAQDINGKPVELEAEGFEARVIQHEYDHLDGVMIVDRTEREQRREALGQLREHATRLDRQ